MEPDVIDLQKGEIIRARGADGQPCHFKFNQETGEMQKIAAPRPAYLDFLPLHSKFCKETKNMIVVVWDMVKHRYEQIVFHGEQGFEPAPPCACSNCRDLRQFEADFRIGRARIGYTKQMVDEKNDALIPLDVSWNRDHTRGHFSTFVDEDGRIGRYEKKEGESFWRLVRAMDAFRITPWPRAVAMSDKDLQFHYYEMCPHINQQIFYCTVNAERHPRQFMFNTHHIQFDEMICTECASTTTYRDSYLYKNSGLITLLTAERIQKTIGVFQSERGTLEWGIYSPEKMKFVQESRLVADCRDMAESDILARYLCYTQDAKCRLDNFEFTCPATKKHFATVFTETTPTHNIHWAMDDTGQLHPFELVETPGSPSLGELVMLTRADVLEARDLGLQVITQKLERMCPSEDEQRFLSNQILSMALAMGRDEDLKRRILRECETEQEENEKKKKVDPPDEMNLLEIQKALLIETMKLEDRKNSNHAVSKCELLKKLKEVNEGLLRSFDHTLSGSAHGSDRKNAPPCRGEPHKKTETLLPGTRNRRQATTNPTAPMTASVTLS